MWLHDFFCVPAQKERISYFDFIFVLTYQTIMTRKGNVEIFDLFPLKDTFNSITKRYSNLIIAFFVFGKVFLQIPGEQNKLFVFIDFKEDILKGNFFAAEETSDMVKVFRI